MIAYFFSTLLGVFIMFGIPGLIAWFIISPWNQRRLARARRYRAVHGTAWWTPETEEAQRRRQFIAAWRDRTEALDV